MTNFSVHSFVLGIMSGVLLTGVWFLGGDEAPFLLSQSSLPHLATSTASAALKSGAISVNNQPAGDTVAIESVTVPPPGVWVAVREVSGDELGNVLGAVRVSNPKSNLTVPLLRSTEPDRTYAVELYRDDDGGNFDPAVNSVYVDFDTGSRVVSYFMTAN